MPQLFEVKETDQEFYKTKLQNFLPPKILDIHTHVWLDKFRVNRNETSGRSVTWPSRVAQDNSIQDLIQTYNLLLPGKEVKAAIFSNVGPGDHIDQANDYVSKCAKEHDWPAFLFAQPQWSADDFERKMLAGKFLGTKVYLSMSDADIPESEITIFDFLPHHQLQVLNDHGWIAMLHIPRPGRLKDSANLGQMIEIENRYPNVKLIIAHVGRAYCDEDLGNAFEILADTEKMMFDFSANTNAHVFTELIKAVGPERILFGSDMPITRMRMRRVTENGKYVNIVPEGLYGDVSADKNMRQVQGEEAEKLTFFLYEEIEAFRQAAKATNLKPADIEKIFYSNAAELLRQS